jgi:CheY-like chemotaxis protein
VIDLPDRLPPALADANQLEMAILNLSVNARDAMPDGGVLTIAVADHLVEAGQDHALEPGQYIVLSVVDTGVGMDVETQRRATEPFFSTKGIGKGTGLGLSMVHGLAAQLNGGLEIHSQPGLGTRVDLWLPIAGEPAATNARISNVEEASPPRRTGRALLVDDEPYLRMAIADMVQELGYSVVEASSALEAQALLRNGEEIDFIITDHLMPGMTGGELAQSVRENRPDLPILLVSGYADVDGIAPNLPRLSKPFRQAELAQALAALLNDAAPPSIGPGSQARPVRQ